MEEYDQKVMELLEGGQKTTTEIADKLHIKRDNARAILKRMKSRKLIYAVVMGGQFLWRKYPRVK